ncbi:hypothetical protein BKA70DRAFT_1227172 [Coprinopsis sp. MPI-PUGE-AT-0042]|nr:hypothetical protein BKA70DRAFT_1227172 [Coprinopsis sp. MPI-PUGE-AT-0042]
MCLDTVSIDSTTKTFGINPGRVGILKMGMYCDPDKMQQLGMSCVRDRMKSETLTAGINGGDATRHSTSWYPDCAQFDWALSGPARDPPMSCNLALVWYSRQAARIVETLQSQPDSPHLHKRSWTKLVIHGPLLLPIRTHTKCWKPTNGTYPMYRFKMYWFDISAASYHITTALHLPQPFPWGNHHLSTAMTTSNGQASGRRPGRHAHGQHHTTIAFSSLKLSLHTGNTHVLDTPALCAIFGGNTPCSKNVEGKCPSSAEIGCLVTLRALPKPVSTSSNLTNTASWAFGCVYKSVQPGWRLKGCGIIPQGLYCSLLSGNKMSNSFNTDRSQTTNYRHFSRKQTSLRSVSVLLNAVREGGGDLFSIGGHRLWPMAVLFRGPERGPRRHYGSSDCRNAPKQLGAIDNSHIKNATGSELIGSACASRAIVVLDGAGLRAGSFNPCMLLVRWDILLEILWPSMVLIVDELRLLECFGAAGSDKPLTSCFGKITVHASIEEIHKSRHD